MTNFDWFILINCTIVSLSLGIAFYYWHAYHELSYQLDEIWADSYADDAAHAAATAAYADAAYAAYADADAAAAKEWLNNNTLEDMARYN